MPSLLNHSDLTPVIDPEKTDLATIGSMLEHAAFQALFEQLEHAPESAELDGILVDRASELGRHLGSLEWTRRAVSSRDDLEERIICEKIVFFLDTPPAARVRAYDWLVARDSAPPGYDPLDSIKKRRTAVTGFIAARRAAAEGVSP